MIALVAVKPNLRAYNGLKEKKRIELTCHIFSDFVPEFDPAELEQDSVECNRIP